MERLDGRDVNTFVTPQREMLLWDDLKLVAVLMPDAFGPFGGGLTARAGGYSR